ncbi:cysteine desulfurase [Candidatus Woesearchaeota archaeon]|nr:cysteine desulfurase [Candidatus Woesearchaeota archaeon]
MEIYLDNAATTKPLKEAVETMKVYLESKYGNPSSLHFKGKEAFNDLEEARKKLADITGAKTNEIIFTSGATESNTLAILGVLRANPTKKHIIVSKIEHSSVLNLAKQLEREGYKVTYIDVDKEGYININQLKKNIDENTVLASIIHANNEIGVIQNIKEIGWICKNKKIIFHTDASQSFTKVKIDVVRDNIDLMTFNSHKIHGPKGVGVLYKKEGIKIRPLFLGEQEYGLRAGTENIANIMGFVRAAEIAFKEFDKNIKNIFGLRDKLIKGLLEIKDSWLNGPTDRLCNNINVSFKGVEADSLLLMLDEKGICASAGSACSSRKIEPSYVLKAIGLTSKEANSSLRLSLSKFNTEKEIEYTLKIVKECAEELRKRKI